jgi:hypothetical protein
MATANVPLDIVQGEDWSAQILWTDTEDQPMYLATPCQIDFKDVAGRVVLTLTAPPNPSPGVGEIPEMAISPQEGIIQLHIKDEITETLVVGEYSYDLFVSVTDSGIYAGTQRVRLMEGTATVYERVTDMP